jgi:hypothetical protein
MRETTTEAKQGYLARRKSRVRRKAERRSLDREKKEGHLDKKDSLDDEDDGNEGGVLLVHEEDYFDFGSDGEPSSGEDSDVELHPQGVRLSHAHEGHRGRAAIAAQIAAATRTIRSQKIAPKLQLEIVVSRKQDLWDL